MKAKLYNVITALLLLITFQGSLQKLSAQNFKFQEASVYWGFKPIEIDSDLDAIDGSEVFKSGAGISAAWGKQGLNFPIAIGYYLGDLKYSPRSFSIFEADAGAQFKLNSLISKEDRPFNILINPNLRFQNIAYMGTYVDHQLMSNPSVKNGEPLVGDQQFFYLNLGLGVEYMVRNEVSSIGIFAMAGFQEDIVEFGNDVALRNTEAFQQTSFTIGVKVGPGFGVKEEVEPLEF